MAASISPNRASTLASPEAPRGGLWFSHAYWSSIVCRRRPLYPLAMPFGYFWNNATASSMVKLSRCRMRTQFALALERRRGSLSRRGSRDSIWGWELLLDVVEELFDLFDPIRDFAQPDLVRLAPIGHDPKNRMQLVQLIVHQSRNVRRQLLRMIPARNQIAGAKSGLMIPSSRPSRPYLLNFFCRERLTCIGGSTTQFRTRQPHIRHPACFEERLSTWSPLSKHSHDLPLGGQSSLLHTPRRWEGERRRRLVLSRSQADGAENGRQCCLLERRSDRDLISATAAEERHEPTSTPQRSGEPIPLQALGVVPRRAPSSRACTSGSLSPSMSLRSGEPKLRRGFVVVPRRHKSSANLM